MSDRLPRAWDGPLRVGGWAGKGRLLTNLMLLLHAPILGLGFDNRVFQPPHTADGQKDMPNRASSGRRTSNYASLRLLRQHDVQNMLDFHLEFGALRMNAPDNLTPAFANDEHAMRRSIIIQENQVLLSLLNGGPKPSISIQLPRITLQLSSFPVRAPG